MEHLGLVNDEQGQRSFVVQVYMWMTLALLITAVVAFSIASSPSMCDIFLENNSLFIILLIAELFLVGALSKMIKKMSSTVAIAVFFLYAILNGITFSGIFLAYDLGSVANVFLITAGTFGIMCAYGYFTHKDLSSIGNICFMGLIGIIIATIVNIFIFNSILYMAISILGVIIFVGLTAYDTQKIKKMARSMNYNEDMEVITKGSIIGALSLYLDFMNLFLYFLRLFGKRK
jgi:FtsH-binding integral membrane protein